MEDKDKEKLVKTGTTTVGIVCSDGIVMAADKRTTAGYMVANKRQKKIVQISDNMAVTQAGLVSDAQLLSKLIKAEIKLKDIQTRRHTTVKEAANLLAGMLYQNIRKMSMVPGIVGFLLGGFDKQGPQLYELGVDGSVTKFEDFASDGSGSVFALGVLETLYREGITVDEGIKLAEKAVNAALKKDIATGNGIDIISLTSEGFKHIMTKEVSTGLEE
jgi:proteasome beta subunit